MADKKETKETKKRDPMEMLLKGEKITFTKATRRGKFTIQFPLPSDLRRIELLLSEMLQGKPIDSFTKQAIADMRVYATLDIVVVDSPDWWKQLVSSEKCPDNELVSELYRSYLRFYGKVQTLMADGTSQGSPAEGLSDDVDEALAAKPVQGSSD